MTGSWRSKQGITLIANESTDTFYSIRSPSFPEIMQKRFRKIRAWEYDTLHVLCIVLC